MLAWNSLRGFTAQRIITAWEHDHIDLEAIFALKIENERQNWETPEFGIRRAVFQRE